MKKIILSFFVLVFLLINNIQALSKETLRTWGDYFQIGLILHAYGSVYSDKEALPSLLYHTGTTLGTGYILKGIIQEKRPDYKPGDHRDSFPSGHTFAAFIGPTFVHQRYGFWQSLPAYVLASFVGYTRVLAKRHYWHDVIGGALVAYGSSLIWVKPYKKLEIEPTFSSEYKGVQFTYRF